MRGIFILVSGVLLLSVNTIWLKAQPSPTVTTIKGTVFEMQEDVQQPLTGVNIYWSGTTTGTISDTEGNFTISPSDQTKLLVFSFTGYRNDTLSVTDNEYIEVILDEGLRLDEVNIFHRRKSTELSMLSTIKTEHIGEGELEKAACCNLSESFETNPSVDVSYTDAITGTKQIQMLGLAGPNTQITRENIPDIRGLSAVYGMEYIPGPWIESIQLNKGTGSVVNGFESIAGQINVELRKPTTADRLYLNVFANSESRLEANLNLSQKISEHLSAGLLLHGRNQSVPMDNNGDSFLDKPLGNQLIALSRLEYNDHEGWHSQFGVKGTLVETRGGQIGPVSGDLEDPWLMEMDTRRLESWFKLGKASQSRPYQSFGLQIAGAVHQHASLFGLKDYSADQQSAYINFIYQSVIFDTRHKYRTGISLQADKYTEALDSLNFERNETVPGVFFEYAWSPGEKFDLVAGLRGDYHNLFGFFLTPRLHIRYAPVERVVFRLSAGRGQRTASIFAENMAVLASSRQILIRGEDNGDPYGLGPEVAWNMGGNLTWKFRLDYREGTLSFDGYYTLFQNQIIADLDEDPQHIYFYNLDGKSTAASFQTQFDYELIRRLDLRLAYRWYDVQTWYMSGIKPKPLLSQHRSFINLAYSTRNHWKFDYTVQWYGPKRIPSTVDNPPAYQLPDESPSYFLMNAQISKEWGERFEIYLGGENLLNFRQEDPIVAADDPFGPYFDSSMIWGPIFGRMFYGGIRLKIR